MPKPSFSVLPSLATLNPPTEISSLASVGALGLPPPHVDGSVSPTQKQVSGKACKLFRRRAGRSRAPRRRPPSSLGIPSVISSPEKQYFRHCGKTFVRPSEVNRHRKTVHVPRHHCPACKEEISPWPDSIRRHCQIQYCVNTQAKMSRSEFERHGFLKGNAGGTCRARLDDD